MFLGRFCFVSRTRLLGKPNKFFRPLVSKPIPPPSSCPRGHSYKFDFRADHANITVLARVKGNRKYILMPPYSKSVR